MYIYISSAAMLAAPPPSALRLLATVDEVSSRIPLLHYSDAWRRDILISGRPSNDERGKMYNLYCTAHGSVD